MKRPRHLIRREDEVEIKPTVTTATTTIPPHSQPPTPHPQSRLINLSCSYSRADLDLLAGTIADRPSFSSRLPVAHPVPHIANARRI